MTSRARQNVLEHAGGQCLSAGLFTHRHLPDEQRVGFLRKAISRDKAHNLAITQGSNRCVGKVRALQQVALGGVGIQRRALPDQAGNRGSQFRVRHVQFYLAVEAGQSIHDHQCIVDELIIRLIRSSCCPDSD